MAGSVNKVILVGNLGRDPETRQTQDGKPIANFTVATNETWKDRQTGERRERVEWHRVVIFNEHLAEIAQRYLHKGSKVYLEGQLQTRKWTDQSGQERYTTEVVIQRFRGELTMLDTPRGRRRRRRRWRRRTRLRRGRAGRRPAGCGGKSGHRPGRRHPVLTRGRWFDHIPQRRARVTCSRARVNARRSLAYAHTRIVRPRTWTCDARSRRPGLRPGPLDSPDHGAVHGARRPRQYRAMRRSFSRARIRATSRARIRATQSEGERATAVRMSGRERPCPTESHLSHLISLNPGESRMEIVFRARRSPRILRRPCASL